MAKLKCNNVTLPKKFCPWPREKEFLHVKKLVLSSWYRRKEEGKEKKESYIVVDHTISKTHNETNKNTAVALQHEG